MAQDFGEGIFSMEVITNVSRLSPNKLASAKLMAEQAIGGATTATQKNRDKATALIAKANSVQSLAIAMSNFSLAHQGLKTIR